MQGWKDSELTKKGIQNAISLGMKLINVDFKALYCSPSRRTLKTAELICNGMTIPLFVDLNLREINMGVWEGQTHTVIKEQFPMEYQAFWQEPHLYNPIEGESFHDLENRVKLVLNKIKQENSQGNVLMVTHTVVIKTVLAYYKKLSLEQLWKPPYINDTCLSIIQIDNDENIKILMEADTSHVQQHEA